MEDKAYIVIDDDDQRLRMSQRINNVLEPDGYKVKSFFYNPTDRDYWDEGKESSLRKLVDRIQYDTKTYHINVVATDYQFSGTKFNGIDVVHELRRNGLPAHVFLYSGNETRVAGDLFASEISLEHKITRFATILRCRIERFLNRDTYDQSIVESLRKKYTVKEIVLKKMEEYQDTVVKFESQYFEGRTFAEVSREIKDDTLHGNRFIAELLEFSIAHFSRLNEK